MSNPSIGSLTLLEAEKVEVSGLCGIDRTLYFAATGQMFVMMHAFQKKSHKPPKRELVKARERMNE